MTLFVVVVVVVASPNLAILVFSFSLFLKLLAVIYTAFADSSFAKIDFVDYRRWWTIESKLSSLGKPPKGLHFGSTSTMARVIAFETAGQKYDDQLKKNGCRRCLTKHPTGMIFREFVSADNSKEKWTRITYPNNAEFDVTLINWIPAGSYLKRMKTSGRHWRGGFDVAVGKIERGTSDGSYRW